VLSRLALALAARRVPEPLVNITVTINLSGFERIGRDLNSNGSARSRILTKWAFRYRVFAERRFIKFSQGGGNWKPLKRKRARGAKARAAVLRDTGILLAALSPRVKIAPGGLYQPQGFGVIVGFGGPAKHKSGKATIAAIASFHQLGSGHLPVRRVIEQPDKSVLTAMQADAVSILDP